MLRQSDNLFKIDIFKLNILYTPVVYQKFHEEFSEVKNQFQESQSPIQNYPLKFEIISNINHSKIIHKFKDDQVVNPINLNNQINKLMNPSECLPTYMPSKFDYNTLVIYFLGGAFVGGHTNMHHIITNDIALHQPVMAFYQRLSPENPQPCAINDAYRAIMQVTQGHIRKNLGYIPKRIILAGDSSGGNIACVLMNILINEQLQQIVHGIWLLWPIINFYPLINHVGHFYALKAKLMNQSTLKQIFKCQLGGDISSHNQHEWSKQWSISPLFTSDEVLRRYPPTYIMGGELDCTTYDSLIFARKLYNNNVKVKFNVIKDMENSFLYLKVGIKELKIDQHIEIGLEFIKDCIVKQRMDEDSMSLPSERQVGTPHKDVDYFINSDRI